jgi:hypothetical protein
MLMLTPRIYLIGISSQAPWGSYTPLVPTATHLSLYENPLDVTEFPLIPGEFHFQNIKIITDPASELRIASVIDWEFPSTAAIPLSRSSP